MPVSECVTAANINVATLPGVDKLMVHIPRAQCILLVSRQQESAAVSDEDRQGWRECGRKREMVKGS